MKSPIYIELGNVIQFNSNTPAPTTPIEFLPPEDELLGYIQTNAAIAKQWYLRHFQAFVFLKDSITPVPEITVPEGKRLTIRERGALENDAIANAQRINLVVSLKTNYGNDSFPITKIPLFNKGIGSFYQINLQQYLGISNENFDYPLGNGGSSVLVSLEDAGNGVAIAPGDYITITGVFQKRYWFSTTWEETCCGGDFSAQPDSDGQNPNTPFDE